jgi:adenine-specific DNA-methyltransferase
MPNKPTFETPDLTQSNIDKIAALFPSVITEAVDDEKSAPEAKVYKKAINFEALKQLLTDEALSGNEAYEFTWVGKKASIVEASKPIRKTLRPCKEESRDWETTQNLYIEGDNLEVLKLLQESYLGKVKMVYIDPPYNTGNDFVYRDKWAVDSEQWSERTGEYDETDNRLFRNKESNGRFHSDWCSMIYPRLMLARNLLSDDGVIFISIDDNEVAQLRKICDEVFGEGNFIAELVWERAYAPKNDAKYISNSHDYILTYVKSINHFQIGRLARTEAANARYSNPDNDQRGVWKPSDLSVKTYNPESDYPITAPSGRIIEPPTGRCWRLSKNAFLERLRDNRIWFGSDGNSVPSLKRFLSELHFEGMAPTSILFYKEVGHSQEGAKEVTKLLEAGVFEGPKPIRFLRRLLVLANTSKDDIILDFFSGSATTAHAVMQLNAEDGGNRKFIMVQLPEPCEKDSEAFKAGYKNICEIGKERIRRAGEKVVSDKQTAMSGDENTNHCPLSTDHFPDIGFRVFKVDSTNMKDVYYGAGEYEQKDLDGLISNIKDDRTDLDLLYGCILEWGLELSYPHKTESIDGFNVHIVNDDPAGATLIVCFDTDISEKALVAIAKQKPLRAVFRDSSFASSPAKINVFELFKLHAPDTEVKVI